jgi:hypothetical protein
VASQLGLKRKAAKKVIINADGMERTVTEAVLFPFLIGSMESEMLAYIMPDPVPHNLLLGRAWMHQVKAKGNYGDNTYTILDSDGKWKPIPKVDITGKAAIVTGPSVLKAVAQTQQSSQQEEEQDDSDSESAIVRSANRELRAILEDEESEHEESDNDEQPGYGMHALLGKVKHL